MIWGETYDEETRRLDKTENVHFLGDDPEEIEVRKGYQRWFAKQQVRLACGRWAWKEHVYRHRKKSFYGESYYWEYHEGNLQFRFHVLKGKDMSQAEINLHHIQKNRNRTR